MPKTLKNDSKRKFQFGSDFKNQKYFKPGDVAVFDDETAETLLKQPGVIDVNNYKLAFDNTKVEDHSGEEKPVAGKKKGKSSAPSDDALAAAL